MERVITLGLRYEDFVSQRELFALDRNGTIQIVGEVFYDPADEEIFFCRMTIQDAMLMNPDRIVYCRCTYDEAKEKLEESGYGNQSGKLSDVSSIAEPVKENLLRKQIGIIREIIQASDSQVSDRNWMRQRLFEYGFYPFFKLVKKPQPGVVWSTSGILQVPDEFLDFCMYISGLHCRNAIEVGVARGGSSYVMAALLYRNNPEMVYNMVDIEDMLVSFEEMKKIVPSLNKRIPSTSMDYLGERYDFCFIDADHSYAAVMKDYENVGRYAEKLTVFHDVFGHEYDELDGGTVRAWREVKELNTGKDINEFSSYPDKWMGIGVIDWERKV